MWEKCLQIVNKKNSSQPQSKRNREKRRFLSYLYLAG